MADEENTSGNAEIKTVELPEEAVYELLEAGPAEYGKAESANKEGIMGLELSKNTLLFYGVRSFILALIIIGAFALMNVKAFLSGDADLMAIALANMRELAFVAVTAFFIAKSKGGS